MLVLWVDPKAKTFKQIVEPVIKGYDVEQKRIPINGKLPQLNPGDVCLGYGNKALEILQKAGLVPKNRKLGSLRESEIKVNDGQSSFMLTYSPNLVMLDYARKPEIQWDTRLAIRKVLTGKLEPEVGKYRYVDDFSDAIAYIKKRHETSGKAVPTSVDLETIGLIPYLDDKYIVSICVTYEPGKSDMIYFEDGSPLTPKLQEQITWLLTTPKALTRGANFKFDKTWMAVKWGIECTNDKFDTLLVGSLLDENRSNTLNLHAKIFTGMGGYDDAFNKTFDKSRMDLVPKPDMLLYGGGDTDACYRTANALRKDLLKDKRLTNFYVKLVQPASQVFEKVERRGMLVDPKIYEDLKVEVGDELKRLEGEAFSMMPRRLRIKYSDNLSLTRAVILQEFLFTPRGLDLKPQMFTPKPNKDGDPNPSTSIEHLEMFADIPEAKQFVDLMRGYNSAKKTMSTYIVGFQKHLRPDGMFHPTYILHRGDYGGDDSGTVTGRTSCKDPAYQTIPKHTKWAKPLRRVYVPPPGYVILNADYSQGELRIAASVSEEPTMIEAYNNGIDLHSVTAAKLAGYEFEDFMKLPEDTRDEYRSGGKAGNFGLLYGMGWAGFQIYARNTYGVILTDEQAQAFPIAFFDLYNGLVDWHKDSKAFAHAQGFIRSPLGRVRHLPLINSHDNEVRAKQERQSINSPIQATLSDLAMLAMVHLDRRYPDLWMFGMTHDSISMYVPEDEVDMWATRVTEVMENLPLHEFGWKPKLAFPADVEIGVTNMAELKKYKF